MVWFAQHESGQPGRPLSLIGMREEFETRRIHVRRFGGDLGERDATSICTATTF